MSKPREPKPPRVKVYYTVTEVAELLRVARPKVEKWCESAQLPGAFKLPGELVWRIPREAIDALINAGMPEPVRLAPAMRFSDDARAMFPDLTR